MQLVPDTTGLVIEDVFFAAGDHRLHGELAYPETGTPQGAVVLAGPHPLLGGTMHNNVVRGLGDGLARRGLLSLRFDYRGVGRSEGPRLDGAAALAQFWQTSHVPQEMALADDVQAAAAHVREIVGPELPLSLLGYSFGCVLLPHVSAAEPCAPLVLVAPTIAKHDYAAYLPLTQPKLVIASEDDFASDAGRLQAWFERLLAPRALILRRFDNHFFRGHEDWLAEAVFGFLRQHGR